ncbi:hypothetical protein AXG93_3617s1060 [Marchantia polymorpha subsp. ruderalis]|uniref:Uncharacterized protein n=1 Tax=Marchantia polymorpha subsp. ruderalis TaxID=1480154 RepID=A0A176WDH1_MARPO|nr:hypothetical protein AXG93_3617s1060 [Marchantia polymorpha subsp. ruderalis]
MCSMCMQGMWLKDELYGWITGDGEKGAAVVRNESKDSQQCGTNVEFSAPDSGLVSSSSDGLAEAQLRRS